jgi:hypothetical protein
MEQPVRLQRFAHRLPALAVPRSRPAFPWPKDEIDAIWAADASFSKTPEFRALFGAATRQGSAARVHRRTAAASRSGCNGRDRGKASSAGARRPQAEVRGRRLSQCDRGWRVSTDAAGANQLVSDRFSASLEPEHCEKHFMNSVENDNAHRKVKTIKGLNLRKISKIVPF